MHPYRIAVIYGSAPGAELAVGTAMTALRRLGLEIETYEQDLGEQRFLSTGELLPPDTIAELRSMDAIFCGSPPSSRDSRVPRGTLERGLLFGLRRELALQINVRSFRDQRPGANGALTVVRENSEGAYFNEGTTLAAGSAAETSIELSTTTYAAAYRCVQHAAVLATTSRSRLTLAHKSNVLVASGQIWERALADVSALYPDVSVNAENVDTLCGRMITDPGRYDVVVSDNVFGDIVSDVACAVMGAADYASSVELSGVGGPSLFEPMHGPQDEVTVLVSPLGALAAAGALASQLGETEIGRALQEAAWSCGNGDIGADRSALVDWVCVGAEQRLAAVRERAEVGR